MTQEALKLVLPLLEDCVNSYGLKYERPAFVKAITAIKEALAKEKALQALHNENERLGLYKDAYAQPEQKPVAWRAPNWSNLHGEYGYRDFDDPVIDISTGKPSPYNEPLYTHPQRTWVKLEGEEIRNLWEEVTKPDRSTMTMVTSFARAIEAKLKERNDHSI